VPLFSSFRAPETVDFLRANKKSSFRPSPESQRGVSGENPFQLKRKGFFGSASLHAASFEMTRWLKRKGFLGSASLHAASFEMTRWWIRIKIDSLHKPESMMPVGVSVDYYFRRGSIYSIMPFFVIPIPLGAGRNPFRFKIKGI
jgi:hypothetical protein